MTKYHVNVNGVNYEVEIEKIDASEVKTVETKPQAESKPAGNGETVSAPMPGNILSVKVQNGDRVKAGDVLMILEAMKMENEIMAPIDGIVSCISVQTGQSVETGKVLCQVE